MTPNFLKLSELNNHNALNISTSFKPTIGSLKYEESTVTVNQEITPIEHGINSVHYYTLFTKYQCAHNF